MISQICVEYRCPQEMYVKTKWSFSGELHSLFQCACVTHRSDLHSFIHSRIFCFTCIMYIIRDVRWLTRASYVFNSSYVDIDIFCLNLHIAYYLSLRSATPLWYRSICLSVFSGVCIFLQNGCEFFKSVFCNFNRTLWRWSLLNMVKICWVHKGLKGPCRCDLLYFPLLAGIMARFNLQKRTLLGYYRKFRIFLFATYQELLQHIQFCDFSWKSMTLKGLKGPS